jgi:asparagine synthase (glutamine-hydrolysing)
LQYIPSPHTIFSQIRKLPPAHTLLWKNGEIRIQRYWDPPFLPKTTMDETEAAQAMMAKLRESVELRMIADVPLGAFLSGGKDSSTVVGLMSELSSKPIKTFTIGFEEDPFSELPYARKIAKHFGTDHHEFVVKPDAVELLPKLAWYYGEPFGDSSALPSYYVSKMTRQHVTVALNGDGGDETLAGYPRYQAMKFMAGWRGVPKTLRRGLLQALRAWPDHASPHSWLWRIKRLLNLGLDQASTEYLDTLCFFQEQQKAGLYSEFMKNQTGHPSAPDYLNAVLERARALPGIDRYLYTDLLTYLPECLMVKMDIASMANSLEARSPFLDHEFVELVGRFPDRWKLRGLTQTKYILQKALQGWVPDSILRRKKQGFSVPMSAWFRGNLRPYVSATLLSEKAVSRGLFQKGAVQRLIEETASGKRDHSYGLWALLMLEQWYRVYIDGERPDTF